MRCTKGFTLIELLVVVAIISLLASIAVPHYYESVVKAKTARTIEDMNYVSNLLSAYQVDMGNYPEDDATYPFRALNVLTTPVSFAHDLPIDVYRAPEDPHYGKTFFYGLHEGDFASLTAEAAQKHRIPSYVFALASYGPDHSFSRNAVPQTFAYDPTNGTISDGNIWLFGP